MSGFMTRTAPRLALFIPALALLTFSTTTWEKLLRWSFPERKTLLYELAALPELVGEHLVLVGISGGLAALIGIALGVGVTRGWGREFLGTVNSISSLGQTFPPVAVLALAVPVVGFGAKPTIIALLLYGLLPVVRNTVLGLEGLDPATLEAARGMGMTGAQRLVKVELPLAAPLIMAGVRTSTVINVGTATLGATIGAGGLGKPVVAGLIGDNPAYIVQGAVLVALLALVIDTLLSMVSREAPA